jgi:hypothetical protein
LLSNPFVRFSGGLAHLLHMVPNIFQRVDCDCVPQ